MASAMCVAAARAGCLVVRAGHDPDQVRERRIAQRTAALELAGQEAVGVVAGGGLDRGRGGRAGLDEHAAAARAAAGAARELRDQRERPLLGAEVREAQGRVGVEHDAERHVREVVALGHHLGAEQEASRRGVEAREQLRHGVLGRRRVGVEAEDRDIERLLELGFHALGARAVAGDGQRAAVVAAGRDRLAVAAVVAGERALGAVQHERDLAARALPGLPARLAREEVRPPAAVQQHDRLARGRRAPAASRDGAGAGTRACRARARAAGRARRRPAPGAAAAASGGPSPGAAWRSRRAAARSPGTRGTRRRDGRRSAGRPRACRTRRAPRRRRSARASRRARTRPSAARPRSAPRRRAAGATRRSARRRRARSAAARRCRRSGPRTAPPSAASARSRARGRSRLRRVRAPWPPRGDRPRSCPSRSRRAAAAPRRAPLRSPRARRFAPP